MQRFFKEHWILLLALLLLLFMAIPLLHFGNFLRSWDRHPAGFDVWNPGGSPRLGFCLNDLAERRWAEEQVVWRQEAAQRRIPFRIRIAHRSLERQIRQLRRFIAEKAAVVILVPVSRSGLADVLQEAVRAGTKIILYDELTAGPVEGYCGPDYRQLGRSQAAALVAAAGPGNYLLFRGPADSAKAERLTQGQLEAIRQAAPQRARLLATVVLPGGAADQAAPKTRTFLTHQPVKGILTPDDLTVAEISRFLQQQQPPLPFLGGVGGEAEIEQRIKTGAKLITVRLDYARLARTAFENARRLLDGSSFHGNATIQNGSAKIPAWLLRDYAILPSIGK